MIREMLHWAVFAIPTAGLLVAIAIVGLIASGITKPALHLEEWIDPAGFLLLQTLGPIALWGALTHRWRRLRDSRAEPLLFPFAVAAVGFAALALFSEPLWPEGIDALTLSAVAWIGFSWALLVARAVADRCFVRAQS